MNRIAILAVIFTLTLSTPVCAGAKKYGDTSGSGSIYEPFLVTCAAYLSNGSTIGSHGDPVGDGMIAGHPEWYGMTVVIYTAEKEEDGSYKLGEYIETGEILDTGYGFNTKDGIPSRIREDKSSRGSIEIGESIDKWVANMEEAKEWMKLTEGHVFIQLIDAEG